MEEGRESETLPAEVTGIQEPLATVMPDESFFEGKQLEDRLDEFPVVCDEALESRYQLVFACGWMERLLIAGLNMFCWSKEGVDSVAGAGDTPW